MTAVGCSTANDDAAARPGLVERGTQALVDSVTDADTPEANAVVSLGDNECTGTLVTPQLVLTALHCIRRPENVPECSPSLPSVRLGVALASPEPDNPFRSTSTTGWRRRTTFTVTTSSAGLTRRTWNYLADCNYWRVGTAAGEPFIPDAESTWLCSDAARVGAGTCLDGALWHHARTPIGETEPNAGGGAGAYVGIHGGTDLPNHFVPIAPDLAFLHSMKAVAKYRHLWWWQKLVDPLPPFAGPGFRKPRPHPIGLDDLAAAHVIHDTGLGRDIEPTLSRALRKGLTRAFVAAPILEPETAPRNLVDTLEAALLSADTSDVVDLVVHDGPTLRLGSELGWDVHGGDLPGAPPPREGAITFLSPSLGGVVVAGGVEPGTTKPTPSVHLYRPTLGWVRVAPSTGAFTNVRAAIYSPADQHLWVLDAIAEDRIDLVRVNPFTHEVEKVGGYSWDAQTYVRHTLSVDLDGGVLLTASTAFTSKTARVALLQAGGEATGSARRVFEFPQSVAPFAGRLEYSFVAEDTAGNTTAVARYPDLPAVAPFSLQEFFQ